jgi:RNA polymerase sigma-70 factor, ECF subfamily
VLHYLDGYSLDEISRMLSLPKGTVKSQLHRARKLMKTAYHNEEMFTDDEA